MTRHRSVRRAARGRSRGQSIVAAWGQLVHSIPVQANPSTTWISDAAGLAAAMTVKVTQ